MKILFVLGFPNPFGGAGFTRIGFFSEAWSKKRYSVEVLGTFSYKALQKRGTWKFGKVNIFNIIFRMELGLPLVFLFNSLMFIFFYPFYYIFYKIGLFKRLLN